MKKIGRNDPCWCGSGKKYKTCHQQNDEKTEYYKSKGILTPERFMIKNQRQIDGIRESGKVNVEILDYVAENIGPGMPTEEIDRLVSEKTKAMGGVAAPLGFEGYPKSVCTSVNNQVCHGIPSSQVFLREGDIVNVDVSTLYRGYYSDSSRMFCIGRVSPENERLVRVAKECVEIGLQKVKPWEFLGDMGEAVHSHALENGYTVVKEIGGHGTGIEFHEDPFVSYVARKGTEVMLAPGMVFTIEPMVNMGTDEIYVDEKNGWTVYTADGKPSAQWEVTVLVTADGHEALAW